jgi:hypothetical protein
MKNGLKGAAVVSAVAALFATAHAEQAKAPAKEKAGKTVRCEGINACKGKSACMTKETACAGMNACKGKGWIKVSEQACKEKGGKVLPEE